MPMKTKLALHKT